jgi:hypothetical protein
VTPGHARFRPSHASVPKHPKSLRLRSACGQRPHSHQAPVRCSPLRYRGTLSAVARHRRRSSARGIAPPGPGESSQPQLDTQGSISSELAPRFAHQRRCAASVLRSGSNPSPRSTRWMGSGQARERTTTVDRISLVLAGVPSWNAVLDGLVMAAGLGWQRQAAKMARREEAGR